MMTFFWNEIFFWVGFVLFNALLFSVNYLLNFKEADFFPFYSKSINGGRGFFMSENQDVFRCCVDVSILFILCKVFESEILNTLTAVYYVFVFVFNAYHYSFKYLYETSPTIVNDYKLARQGIMYVWAESKVLFLSYLLGLLALVLTLFAAIKWYLLFSTNTPHSELTYTGIGMFLFLTTIALLKKGYMITFDTWYRFLFFPLRLRTHVLRSINLIEQNKSLDTEDMDSLNYGELKQKPNVHVLLIESYGSLLIKDPELLKEYHSLLDEFVESLSARGFDTNSNTSESVSLIGPSWLAYSTILLGKRITSNYAYEKIMYGSKQAQFPSIQKTLQNQGYKSYFIDAGQIKKGIHVPFREMTSLFGIDQWLLEGDIPYNGTLYGFTESPPDQYVLNYSFEEYLQKTTQPYVCFYLTKNSHSPFISPEFNTTDWRSLNNTPRKLTGEKFLQTPEKEEYIKAIKYQLNMIQDLIINKATQNDVFLLMGDHQPHVLAGVQEHGIETIVHVIAKDKTFVKAFEKDGFNPDLSKSTKVRHENIRDLLLSNIFNTYG